MQAKLGCAVRKSPAHPNFAPPSSILRKSSAGEENLDKLAAIFRRDQYLYSQLLFMLALNIFAGITMYYFTGFTETHSLYWDRLSLVGFFRDNLHSLNRFGEVEWWNPNAGTGFPIYYTSLLGTTQGANPLFVIFGFVFWALGLFDLTITSYYYPYILYAGFAVPILFNLGLLLLARQIFKSPLVIAFILILGSFSPGIVFNVSDDGIELSAYGLFFAAAYLSFQHKPEKKSFWALILSLLVLAVSLNHLSLYWNVIFIPLFVMVCSWFNESGGFIANTKRMLGSVPARYWLVALVLVGIGLLPTLTTFAQGTDLLRTKIGTRTYSFAALRPGNPLEVLSIGTPGVGFEWGEDTGWNIYPADRHVGYTYLGLLALPLSFIGLTVGRRLWRVRLLSLALLTSLVVLLSGYSPLFASILIWESPLRAVNHYSDTVFRLGIFFILILTSGLGLEVITRYPRPWPRLVVPCFILSTLFSLGLFWVVYKDLTPSNLFFGFALAIFVFYLIVLARLAWVDRRRWKREAILFLLALTLIDTSTVALVFVRQTTLGREELQPYEAPAIDSIGTTGVTGLYITDLLILRDIKILTEAGVDLAQLPVRALYSSPPEALLAPDSNPPEAPEGISGEWRIGSPAGEKCLIIALEAGRYELTNEFGEKSVATKENDKLFMQGITGTLSPDLKTISWSNGTSWHRPLAIIGDTLLAEAASGIEAEGKIKVVRQTYNSLTLDVETPKESLLFWRDAYFPGWSATVDGKNVEIVKAFGAFKVVTAPEGKSRIEFRFIPEWVQYALVAAYAVIFITLSLWLIALAGPRRQWRPSS